MRHSYPLHSTEGKKIVAKIKSRFLTLLLSLALGYSTASLSENIRYPLDTPSDLSLLAEESRLVGVVQFNDLLTAVGERGHILQSTDDGVSWVQRAAPVSSNLVAADFSSKNVGWIVGHDGVVLKSEDAGISWRPVLTGRTYGDILVHYYEEIVESGDESAVEALEEAKRLKKEGPDKPFLDVLFLDDENGWVVGAFNLIFKTNDGGETWQPWLHRTENPFGSSLYSIEYIEGDVYIAGEQGLLMRLDKSQDRFIAIEVPYSGTFFGVEGEGRALIVYGLQGSAFLSIDSGRTWASLDTHLSGGITGAAFLSDNRIVLVSTTGEAVLSKIGRYDFERLYYESSMSLNDVQQTSSDTLVFVGAQGIRRITDY